MSARLDLSLREVLAQVPDPRQPRSRRRPLAVCAMLGDCRSLYDMAQWGRAHLELAQVLRFTRERTPCLSTVHHVFRRLDVAAFEEVLSQWALAALPTGATALAVDGKALRGSLGDELPGAAGGSGLCDRSRPYGGAKGEAGGSQSPVNRSGTGTCWPSWIWPGRWLPGMLCMPSGT